MTKYKGILIEDLKAIYFFVPKVACTSFKTIFAKHLQLEYDNVHRAPFTYVTEQDNIADYKNYYKFAIIRNPWDRILSCYLSKVKGPDFNVGLFKNGLEKSVFHKYGDEFFGGMSFENFIKEIAKIPDSKSDPHFASQFYQITDRNNKIIVDDIYKLENLPNELNKLSDRLNLSLESIPHLHKTKDKTYHDFYKSKEMIETVRSRYLNDVFNLNYKFRD